MNAYVLSPHSVTIGAAVDDARNAWQAAEKNWSDMFDRAVAAGKTTDTVLATSLSRQANLLRVIANDLKKKYDALDTGTPLSPILQLGLQDVLISKLGAPVATRSGVGTVNLSPFERWQRMRADWLAAIARGATPGIIEGLRQFAEDGRQAYLATKPTPTQQWQALNDAWADAIRTNAPAAQISDLKAQSEAALADLARAPAVLKKPSADAPATSATAAKSGGAASTAPASTGALAATAIVTSPLWLFALLKRFML